MNYELQVFRYVQESVQCAYYRTGVTYVTPPQTNTPHHPPFLNQRVVGLSHYYYQDVVYIFCVSLRSDLRNIFISCYTTLFRLLFTQHYTTQHHSHTVLHSSCAFLHESHFYATRIQFKLLHSNNIVRILSRFNRIRYHSYTARWPTQLVNNSDKYTTTEFHNSLKLLSMISPTQNTISIGMTPYCSSIL